MASRVEACRIAISLSSYRNAWSGGVRDCRVQEGLVAAVVDWDWAGSRWPGTLVGWGFGWVDSVDYRHRHCWGLARFENVELPGEVGLVASVVVAAAVVGAA